MFVQPFGSHDAGSKFAGIQRAFGLQRPHAEGRCFAPAKDPVQIDIGGEVVGIVVDLEQAQGGDDMRQIGLGLAQAGLVLRDSVADAVALLAQDGDRQRFAHAPLSNGGGRLAIGAKVSLLHNAGEIGWGTRIRT